MAKVIAICNQKGGVGKTVTTVNLGIGLARAEKKVLLVDMDAQASLTLSLGYQPEQIEMTIASIMGQYMSESNNKSNVFKSILHHKEKVDLLPSNIELSGLEAALVNTMSRETVLRNSLKVLRDKYDYIIVDCSPSLGMLTINSLAFADTVLIPVQAQYLSIKGLEQLIRTISRVKIHINRKLDISGILITMANMRTNYSKELVTLLHQNYDGKLHIFKENRRYIINKLLHNFSFTIIFIVIGELLYFLGVTAPTEYVYFNAVIFVFGMGIIIFNGIVQMVMYRKIVTPMVQLSKYIQYLLFFELFLLAATYRLEIIEWLVGMFAVLSCQLIITMVGKLDLKEKLILKESDYPNPHLYYTREKQLEKFISILEQQKGEPYAVMISGEWGMGKTSFVQALEKKLKELNNDYFVWVYAGSEKSVSDIMVDVAGQILEILKENNIYIENSDLIEKYFVAFSGILEENGLKFFNKIANIFGVTKQDTSKEYINGKLSELSKLDRTIYLIIDDLDRCDKDYQIKMFKVIRESTELVNCKTIFLVDQKVFLDNEYNANYIEKYISYTLDLCKVDCR